MPIEQVEAYYRSLETQYGNQLNPFKMLSMETRWNSRKSCMPYSDSQIELFMNQFHLLRYFRQNFAYLNDSKDISYLGILEIFSIKRIKKSIISLADFFYR